MLAQKLAQHDYIFSSPKVRNNVKVGSERALDRCEKSAERAEAPSHAEVGPYVRIRKISLDFSA